MEIGEYTVHIVDDEEEVRRSLAFLLTATGFTVRVHDSATSFLAVAPSAVGKACLVTDLRMPDMNGVELLEKLNEMGALVPAVVITGHGDVPMAVAAMKAGAVDFVEKPFEDEVLISSITRAAERLHKIAGPGEDVAALRPRLGELSDRERQVLHAIVAGLPNKAIAYDLDISPRTVEVHRANIMSKMRARSLPELVRMAIALGLAE